MCLTQEQMKNYVPYDSGETKEGDEWMGDFLAERYLELEVAERRRARAEELRDENTGTTSTRIQNIAYLTRGDP